MAGVARFEVQMVGDKEAVRRIRGIEGAERKLTRAFKDGRISAQQLRRSTMSLSQAKERLRQRLQTTSRAMQSSIRGARGLTSTLGSLRSMALGVGAAFLAWKVKDIIQDTFLTFAEFEKKMNRVRALTGAVGRDFEALQARAESLGRTTIFTANQVADAMGFLAQAGLTTTQILQSMEGTLNLAAAAQLDMATAGDIVTNIMAGFGLQASQLDNAVDTLTAAFTSANTDLLQLAQGMKLAGPVAKAFGFTFEETAAVLALMGNAGFQASLGGTSLRNSIVRMAKDGEKFNIFIKDAEGNTKAFADIMDDLAREVPEATRQIELLGVRGGPGLQALLGQGSDAVRELIKDMEEAEGLTKRIKDIQLEGLAGALTKLTSAIEGLKNELGKSNGALMESVGFFTDWANAVTDSLSISREFAKHLPELQQVLDSSNAQISDSQKEWLLLNKIMMDTVILLGRPPGEEFAKGIKKQARDAATAIKQAAAEAAKDAKKAETALQRLRTEVVLLGGTPLQKLQQKFEDNVIKLGRLRDAVGNTTEAKRIFSAGVKALTANLGRETAALSDGNKEFEKRSALLKRQVEGARPSGRPSLFRTGEKSAIQSEIQLVRELEREIGQLELNQVEGIVRVIAARDMEIKSLDELIKKHQDNAEIIALLQKKKVLVNAEANLEIENAAKESFERQVATIENFLNQVFTTARSLGDIIKQFFSQILRVITSFIARAVAKWLAGMRQMRGAGAGAGAGAGGGTTGGVGGILGSILGGILGTVPLSGAGAGISAPGLGPGTTTAGATAIPTLSGGQAAALGIGLAPTVATGTAAGGASASASALFSPAFFASLGAAGGLALLQSGLGSGNVGLATAGGALAGASIGFLFGGPIGAGIGAAIGAIAGFFGGRSKRKKQRKEATRLLAEFDKELRDIVQAFKDFRLDDDSAITSIDSLLEQFGGISKRLGKPGKSAGRTAGIKAKSAREEIRGLQASRDARGALSIFENIPEFQSGGFTGGAAGERFLAILHRGEAVLNSQATALLGVQNIAALNQGRNTTGGATVIFTEGSIQVFGERNPKATANVVIAEINRRARNRGAGQVV